jgi:hypothetical protein
MAHAVRTLVVTTMVLLSGTAFAVERSSQDSVPTIVVAAPEETQELVLRDGTRAFGRVERVEDGRVTFRTTSGASIDVETVDVVSVVRVEGRVVEGEFRRADPNPTRLFFAPTGRSLPRGAAYLGVYEILLPFVQVGLTDRISIGGGTPLIFGGGSEHPFWITPKVQVLAAKSTNAAVGVLHFMNVGDGSLGVAYGVITQGSADSALSFGAGYAYERSFDDDGGAALVMIGAEHRLTRGIKFVTENYVWRTGGMGSAGVRWLGERLSADLGLVVPLGSDTLVAFPIVNVVWRFSR